MVAQADIEQFRAAQADLSRRVRDVVAAFFGSLDLSRPENARDALLEFMPLITAQYGDVAATIAVEYYSELRAASGATGSFRALTAAAVPAGAVEAKVRYLAGSLWTPTPGAMLGGLLNATDKYVKQPGRSTIALNAKREGVRYARVPQGAKTCAFCLLLASRDAVYHSRRSAGDLGRSVGDDFHGKCDCAVVRIATDADYPESFLPDNYYSMYSDAVNDDGPEVQAFLASLPADEKNKQLKAAVFSMRRMHPDALTDGVHTH